jgi:hypothetical protein
MIKVFSDFILDLSTMPQTLFLPEGAQVVAVREASDKIYLTALFDATESYGKIRSFKVCTKDDSILANDIIYIGTCETELLGRIYLVELK